MNNFSAPFALCFRLGRHRPLHRLRQGDIAHLDGGDFDSIRFRLLVDHILKVLVDAFALRQQFVQFGRRGYIPANPLDSLRRVQARARQQPERWSRSRSSN